MQLCSRCKKNMAVIFVTKVENGKEISEGLCFQCAKGLGIKPFDKLMEQLNINEDDFANMNEQITEMLGDSDMMGDSMALMHEMMGGISPENNDQPHDGKNASDTKNKKNNRSNKRSMLESNGIYCRIKSPLISKNTAATTINTRPNPQFII